MPSHPTVAVDAMSGDGGVGTAVAGVLQMLGQRQDLRVLLVGDPDAIRSELTAVSDEVSARIEVIPAAEVITMEDSAAVALRAKKQSSMRIAIDLVKRGEAGACVSAGNTGALMALGKFVLKTVPGIDRPAIGTTIPAIDGHTHMLDLGANIACGPEHLFQFATMGAILAEAIDGNPRPRVGLLNVGAEAIKGSDEIKEAARLLRDSSLNYMGFVEGNEIYTDRVDVVVCDGFVGNVSLKTSEGVARMVAHYLRQEFDRNWWTRLTGLFARPILRSFGRRFDPRRYNGASLLGLRGVVIKSHGSADAVAFANAVRIALVEIEHALPDKISQRLLASEQVA